MFSEDFEEPFSFVLARPFLLGVLLFGPFAIALLCYIWAFCSQTQNRPEFREYIVLSLFRRSRELRGAQNTYHAAFILLVCDGFTVITGLVWGILLFRGNAGLAFLIFFNIWMAFRFLSVCQHLIAALISILYVSRPEWGGGLHTIMPFLTALPIALIILSFRINGSILLGVDIYNFLLMLAIVVSCCLLDTSPMAKQRKPFVLLAVSLFLLICLPNAVLHYLIVSSNSYLVHAMDVLFITNLYIVMDALLFYLVLKTKDEGQFDNEYEGAIRSV